MASHALDEKAVTAQARACAPSDRGPSVHGIPVATIHWLLDRQLIRDVRVRYLRGLDRHDAVIMASAFWPDAKINYGKTFSGPRDEFVEFGNDWDAKHWVAHSHNLSNQTVNIVGDVAYVESYVFMLLRAPDDTVTVAAGRYLDKMQRRHGEWRILECEFILDVRGKASGASFEARYGTWGQDDPSYALLNPAAR